MIHTAVLDSFKQILKEAPFAYTQTEGLDGHPVLAAHAALYLSGIEDGLPYAIAWRGAGYEDKAQVTFFREATGGPAGVWFWNGEANLVASMSPVRLQGDSGLQAERGAFDRKSLPSAVAAVMFVSEDLGARVI